MKKRLVGMGVLFSLLFFWGGMGLADFQARPIAQPTELVYWDADRAYNGYTLFTPLQQNEGNFWTYIIDMQGNIINAIDSPLQPRNHAILLENGHFLRLGFDPAVQDAAAAAAAAAGQISGLQTKGGASTVIQELNWDGSVFWEFQYMTKDAGFHHDFRRIWNKKLQQYTFIVNTWERRTPAETLAKYGTVVSKDWSPDSIVEVNYNKEIVWKWCVFDHLVQDKDATKPGYGVLANTPQKLDINFKAPAADWNHTNSLDYNDERGEIVMNIGGSEFAVFDHDNTFVSATNWAANIAAAASTAGDFLYRFGSPVKYKQGLGQTNMTAPTAAAGTIYTPGSTGNDQIMGLFHDIRWIAPYHWNPPRAATDDWQAPLADMALPGAGNFILFDNVGGGPYFTQSGVLEINPYLNASGVNTHAYVWPHLAGYTLRYGSTFPFILPSFTTAQKFNMSNQMVWYYSDKPETFYSSCFVR